VNNSVEDLIRQAAAAAKVAPDHLQEAAFNKAFDALSTANGQIGMPPMKHRPIGRAATSKVGEQEGAKDLAGSLNRTKYPEIDSADSALKNSLRVLIAARDDVNVDGLSASTLSKILTENFRCRYSRQAISQALNSARKYVHRLTRGNEVVFQIMGPGEAYLKAADTGQPQRQGKRTGKKTHSAAKQPKVLSAPALGSKEGRKPTKKSSPKKREPLKDISRLQTGGFFKTPRTIAQIISQLKDKQGIGYKQNELSTPLLRLLRNETLTRNKNKDQQYEYKDK
jgi:hypothetical protein